MSECATPRRVVKFSCFHKRITSDTTRPISVQITVKGLVQGQTYRIVKNYAPGNNNSKNLFNVNVTQNHKVIYLRFIWRSTIN